MYICGNRANEQGREVIASVRKCRFLMQVILPLLIFTFGPVSGAHFNPVVTATFVVTKAMVHFHFYHKTLQLSMLICVTHFCHTQGDPCLHTWQLLNLVLADSAPRHILRCSSDAGGRAWSCCCLPQHVGCEYLLGTEI